jgi:hypothetical protein
MTLLLIVAVKSSVRVSGASKAKVPEIALPFSETPVNAIGADL